MATKNRRTTTSGYARGEDTRARVIASALRLFGQHGFDGTSTREIAHDAGVNAPALQYYFSSKQGLYAACVEHLVARLSRHVEDALVAARGLIAGHAADDTLLDACCTIQERLADFLLASTDAAEGLPIIVREQAGLGSDAGFRLLYKKVDAPLLAINAEIVGRLLRRPVDDEIRIRAMTLNGQSLMFLFMRRTLQRGLRWDRFRADRSDLVKRIVRRNTETLLRAVLLDAGNRRPRRH